MDDLLEPSDLSKAIMDRPEETEHRLWLYVGLATLCLLALATVVLSSSIDTTKVGGDAIQGVQEIEGVLYYPDGQPVRNYEQLNLYLQSE